MLHRQLVIARRISHSVRAYMNMQLKLLKWIVMNSQFKLELMITKLQRINAIVITLQA